MPIQGRTQDNPIAKNAGRLDIVGIAPIWFTKVSEIEEELETLNLPDRREAGSGVAKPVEFTVMLPLHHESNVSDMEDWFLLGKGDVQVGYKKDGSLTYLRNNGQDGKVINLTEMRIKKRKYPDLDTTNENDIQQYEATIGALMVD